MTFFRSLAYQVFDIWGLFLSLFIDFELENNKLLITVTYGVPYTPFTRVIAELNQDGTYKMLDNSDSWARNRAYKRLAKPWYYGGFPGNYKFQSFITARNNFLRTRLS